MNTVIWHSPKKTVRVALLNPPYYRGVYGGVRGLFFRHYLPSLTLAALAGSLIQAGHEVVVGDGADFHTSYSKHVSRIAGFNPDLIGITFTTPLYPAGRDLALSLSCRLPSAQILCGGYHASALPEEILREGTFSAAVMGEGEATLSEYVERGTPERTPGLAYKDAKGEVRVNASRPYLKDLDMLPMPAWELFDFRKRRYNMIYHKEYPVASMETSRGCPYGCSFCSKDVFGRLLRKKSVERVLEEKMCLEAQGFKELYFVDDSFLTDRVRVITICERILSERRVIPWSCHARVDDVDSKSLALMKEAGCHTIAYGIESGSPEILDDVDKSVSFEKIRQAISMTRRHGIRSWGCFIFGLPQETCETMEQSIRYAVDLGLDFAKWSVAVPFPGTPLYKEWKREGRILSQDWAKFKLHGKPQEMYRHPNVDARTITRYYRKAYLKFYARPGYWRRFLRTQLRWHQSPVQLNKESHLSQGV